MIGQYVGQKRCMFASSWQVQVYWVVAMQGMTQSPCCPAVDFTLCADVASAVRQLK